MKLSTYAKNLGGSYDTAYRMFKDKQIEPINFRTEQLIQELENDKNL